MVILFLNEFELICLHTSIAVVYIWLNSFSYCYLTLIILFNINRLYAHSKRVTGIAIYHQSFVYPQLNDQTVLFLKIQFSISHLLALTLNVEQFFLTHRSVPVKCFHFESQWIWEKFQGRDKPHSPKLQHYWRFTIRLFSVISRTFVG